METCEILSNYFKNQTQGFPRFLKLLKITIKRVLESSRGSFKLFKKLGTNSLQDSFKFLQKSDIRGPRDSSKLLQNQTKRDSRG